MTHKHYPLEKDEIVPLLGMIALALVFIGLIFYIGYMHGLEK